MPRNERKGKLSFRHMTVENKKITSLGHLKLYACAASRNIYSISYAIHFAQSESWQANRNEWICLSGREMNDAIQPNYFDLSDETNEKFLCHIIVYCLVSAVVSHFNNVWQHEQTHFSVAILNRRNRFCVSECVGRVPRASSYRPMSFLSLLSWNSFFVCASFSRLVRMGTSDTF